MHMPDHLYIIYIHPSIRLYIFLFADIPLFDNTKNVDDTITRIYTYIRKGGERHWCGNNTMESTDHSCFSCLVFLSINHVEACRYAYKEMSNMIADKTGVMTTRAR